MPTPAPLAPKREEFCRRYAVSMDAARAAREAGYSARSAKQIGFDLLKVPAVKLRAEQLIAEARAEVVEQRETEAEYVRRTTKDVVERCMQRAPVMVRRGKALVQETDAAGNHLWKFDAQAAINALTLFAKLHGMFPKESSALDVNLGGQLAVMVTHHVIDPVQQSSN